MNVFDFDNTIYDGESAIDYFKYYLKKDPSLVKYIPAIIVAVIKYKRGKITVEQMLSKYCSRVMDYIVKSGDFSDDIIEFWDIHEKNIKPLYKSLQSDDDLIISCSPEFSLDEICKRLNIKSYIGTDIDAVTGEVRRLCFRENKVKAFKEIYPNAQIDNFYTDSLNDKPLIDISKNAFLVKGNKIEKIK